MKATDEEIILELVAEGKAKYAQYKRFIEFCRKHMKISDEQIFKIVYFDQQSVKKTYKNGQIIIEGYTPQIEE